MIANILLERFIPQHEPESSARIRVHGFLQIQCVERNYFFRRFRTLFLNDHEMKLVVDHPVIAHVENRAIFKIELR